MERHMGRWWEADKTEIHEHVVSAFRRMDRDSRRARYAIYLGLYEARDISSFESTQWADVPKPSDAQRIKENILKSIVDSATAKISSNKPRPVFLTTSGDFAAQKKAKMRTLFVEGVLHEQKGYAKGRLAFRDGAVMDEGILKFYPDYQRKKVRIDRVLASDVVWDVMDGKYGNPRTLMQFQSLSRSVLSEKYGKKFGATISEASSIREATGKTVDTIDDPVHVVEAWHLPSGPGAKDGRHVICTSAGTLVDERWERERYPLLVWRWKSRMLGWDGMGIIEDVVSLQKELDWTSRKIQEWLNSLAKRGWMEVGSSVALDEIDNSVDGIGFYRGAPPQFTTDPGPNAEILMERDRLKAAAFEQVGLSQLTAQSKKPAGLSSGRALLEYKDTESQRFQDVGLDWDDYWCGAAELIIDAATDLADGLDDRTVEVRTPTSRGHGFESVAMTAEELASCDYMVQIRAASMLPREPAGRLQTIENLMGMFPAAAPVWARYLDHPDVTDAVSLVTAPVDAILADVEQLQAGVRLSPEPFLDLQTAKMIVLSSYLRSRNQAAPESVLSVHRDYLLDVESMIQEQAQAQAQAMAGAPGAGGSPPSTPSGAPGLPPGLPPDMAGALPPGMVPGM